MSNAGAANHMVKPISSCGSGIMRCSVPTNSPEPLIWNSPSNAAAVPALSPNGANALPAAAPSIHAKPIDDKTLAT